MFTEINNAFHFEDHGYAEVMLIIVQVFEYHSTTVYLFV